MNKVFLVDDEPWSLQGIRCAFDWQRAGFEVTGEFSEPEVALEAILSQSPDVVFTDIRMPGLSGIELMQTARVRGATCEFVIISGFAEFSYAREAIRLGAVDYILKPVDLDQTDGLLDKLRQQLEEQRERRDNQVAEALLFGDETRLRACLKGYRPETGVQWVLAVLNAPGADRTELPVSLQELAVADVRMGLHKRLFLLRSEDAERLQTQAGLLPDTASLGFSTGAPSLKQASVLLREADQAAGGHFISGIHGICVFSDHTRELLPQLGQISQAISRGLYPEAGAAMEALRALFMASGWGMHELICLWQTLAPLPELALTDEETASQPEYAAADLTDRYPDASAVFDSLSEILSQLAAQKQNEAGEGETQHQFEQLVRYVDAHFTEELYIRELSAQFYLNQYYCCKLFRKYLSTTFSEYVLELRIREACRLIRNGSGSIEEIATAVGYTDYFYFSKVFKKKCGITPARYRKEHAGCEN